MFSTCSVDVFVCFGNVVCTLLSNAHDCFSIGNLRRGKYFNCFFSTFDGDCYTYIPSSLRNYKIYCFGNTYINKFLIKTTLISKTCTKNCNNYSEQISNNQENTKKPR